MRIALIVAGVRAGGSLGAFADSISKGMQAMGHRVDTLDAWNGEGTRLPGYEYIVVLSEPLSPFSSKLPDCLPKILSSASMLVGKKSAAFLRTSGFFSVKAMSNLMRAMEKEGMFVNWSEFVAKASQAEAAAKRIGA